MKHLIAWHELDPVVWDDSLEAALRLARNAKARTKVAEGRSLCLMFFNPSLRTRTSMEVAAAQMGAHVTTLTPGAGTWRMAFEDGQVMDGAEPEHIQEAAGVLSTYYDAIGVRMFASLTDYERDSQDYLIRRFARASRVPVVNLESAFFHPCQELADAATIVEQFDGDARGRKFVLSWSYHPRALPMAVPNSALTMAARLGMNVTVARPEGYELDRSVMERAERLAAGAGGSVSESTDMSEAYDGAHVIYAKGWAARRVYDHPEEEAATRRDLKHWRVTQDKMDKTDSASFMHCLPVRRNVVVDDDVLDGPSAIHLRQAAYRLYAQKAILEMLWDLRPVAV